MKSDQSRLHYLHKYTPHTGIGQGDDPDQQQVENISPMKPNQLKHLDPQQDGDHKCIGHPHHPERQQIDMIVPPKSK
jgi:hypothetical protein